ncbi:hypothetical protein HYV22_04465 [Candidatus Gottesmanbacteria bacterium]|nr:hypothetical protein [Candidatus Gottesmanbacteria bacterium]
MSKYLITISTEDYLSYVAECQDENEARERAEVDWQNSLERLRPIIVVERVPDDSPIGDA